eukprot:356221-Chlamydomonas_euryale.AAC.3
MRPSRICQNNHTDAKAMLLLASPPGQPRPFHTPARPHLRAPHIPHFAGSLPAQKPARSTPQPAHTCARRTYRACTLHAGAEAHAQLHQDEPQREDVDRRAVRPASRQLLWRGVGRRADAGCA